MEVGLDAVRRIARLARLSLPEEALARYASDLSQILGHMELLARVPSADGPANGPAELGVPVEASVALRDDTGHPIPLASPLEQFAPLVRDGFFLVPRLDTHEQAGE